MNNLNPVELPIFRTLAEVKKHLIPDLKAILTKKMIFSLIVMFISSSCLIFIGDSLANINNLSNQSVYYIYLSLFTCIYFSLYTVTSRNCLLNLAKQYCTQQNLIFEPKKYNAKKYYLSCLLIFLITSLKAWFVSDLSTSIISLRIGSIFINIIYVFLLFFFVFRWELIPVSLLLTPIGNHLNRFKDKQNSDNTLLATDSTKFGLNHQKQNSSFWYVFRVWNSKAALKYNLRIISLISLIGITTYSISWIIKLSVLAIIPATSNNYRYGAGIFIDIIIHIVMIVAYAKLLFLIYIRLYNKVFPQLELRKEHGFI